MDNDEEIRELEIRFSKISETSVLAAHRDAEGHLWYGVGTTPIEAIKDLFSRLYPDKKIETHDALMWSDALGSLNQRFNDADPTEGRSD